MLVIILTIVYFVNYNATFFEGPYGQLLVAGTIYYLVYAAVPWIIVNVYAFIKIRESIEK